jgi:hypothetical protein
VGEAGQAGSGIKAQRGRTAKQAEPGSNLRISVSAKLGSDFRFVFFLKKMLGSDFRQIFLKRNFRPMAVFFLHADGGVFDIEEICKY